MTKDDRQPHDEHHAQFPLDIARPPSRRPSISAVHNTNRQLRFPRCAAGPVPLTLYLPYKNSPGTHTKPSNLPPLPPGCPNCWLRCVAVCACAPTCDADRLAGWLAGWGHRSEGLSANPWPLRGLLWAVMSAGRVIGSLYEVILQGIVWKRFRACCVFSVCSL